MEVRLHDLTRVPSRAETEAAERRQALRQQRQQAMEDARRALVLDAARAVFADQGLAGASIREIARRAGYTAGAIYSYFDSKEAIYEALLSESLARLNAEVSAVRVSRSRPRLMLAAQAQAWFDFYLRHPRDLDLGFHRMRRPAAPVEPDGAGRLIEDHLHDALKPCEKALQDLGLPAAEALREGMALLAHGLGLLWLQHTGRLREPGPSAQALFQAYVEQLLARVAPDEPPAPPEDGQGDLFVS